jgi:hypothetical protein
MNWLLERQMEQEELGFSADLGKTVCGACVGDEALAELVGAEGDADECSFCQATGEGIAADVEVVLERIGRSSSRRLGKVGTRRRVSMQSLLARRSAFDGTTWSKQLSTSGGFSSSSSRTTAAPMEWAFQSRAGANS